MRFKKSVRIRLHRYILLAMLLLPHAASQISFTSKYEGKTVTGLVGSSVNFTWSFSGDVKEVRWGLKNDGWNGFENNGVLVSLGKRGPVSVTVPSAYNLRVNGSRSGGASSGQVIFTLSSITESDERTYGCLLRPTDVFDQSKFDSVYLAVKAPPQINISSVQASYNEGSSVNISCTASGTPDPDVIWIRNGVVKNSGKNAAFLTFSSIKRSDVGQYSCRANNSAGNDENHATLVVHYKPEGTTLATSAAANTVTQGDSVTFTCHVTAAKPQVSQYRFILNGTNLVKDSNNNHFTINNVQRSQHFGEYKCVPHNDVGDGPEASVTLRVNVPVQFIVLPQNVTVNETNPIVMSCDASGFPTPSLTWTKNGQVVSQLKQLNIQRSDRSDAGVYVCTASNGVGQDKTVKAYITVQYPPTIQGASTSSTKSWIGQTVKLKCLSDGVPTPTLTWYKPDGSQINSVRATLNTVDVKMKVDRDFGGYKCDADNGLTPADYKIVKVQKIEEPGSPKITSSTSDIQATSLTVKWTAPADDGGSPITAYRVVILKTGTEIKNENITDPDTTSLSVGDLEKATEYNVKVFARNAFFEGPAGEKTVTTKYEGFPAAATIEDLPSEVTDDTITLKWSKPLDNGKEITQYTVYQRIVTDGKPGEWKKLKTITDISVRELKVELERGKVYEFVVTARNELGESLKEDGKIMRVKASEKPDGGDDIQTGGGEEDDGVSAAVYAGAAVAVVLFIVGVIAVIFLWRRRKASRHDRRLPEELGSENPVEMEDGYQSISREAAQSLQASSPAVEVYANVDLSKKIKRTPQKNAKAYALELDEKSSSIALSGGSTIYEFPSSGEYMPLHPSGRSWEITREQVKIMKVIGKGAFCQVAKATARNIRGDEEYTTVAVKMLKANVPDSDRKDLLSELELMKKLKPHPHVIKLMGCVTKTDPLLVLIEYVPFGDLLGYLRKSRGLKDTYYKDPDVKPKTSLTAEQLMRFAWQIADGMFYLSAKKIIHRDLAARNVLVGEGEKCKVTDFGMARNVHQDDIYTRRSRGRLPVKWTAYEALLYGTYTTQSDVWSYGILLYEILTVGGSPYPGINARQIANKLQEGFRMPKPKHVDNKLYQIMLKCWDENPSNRPTFAKLKNTMKDMERNNRTYVNLKQYDNSLYANVEDLTA